jgi:hypothetical protein
VDRIHLAQDRGPAVSSREFDDDPSGFIRGGKFD